MESLLDILYGCHECGLCACECDDSIPEDRVTSSEPSSPSAKPFETPAPHHPPQPGSSSSSWSPPPTPPCDSCGGTNFGPCPSSVCFACIPPLQMDPELNTRSPSRTPPGTPPPLVKQGRQAGIISHNEQQHDVVSRCSLYQWTRLASLI